jgi:hypothetical protein
MFVTVADKTITNIGIHVACKTPIWFQEFMKREQKILKNHKSLF